MGELEKLNTEKCYQKLTFGPSKQYISNLRIELPVLVRDLHGEVDTLKVPTYVVEADVPFLCGKSELKDEWRAKINTESNILEVKTDRQRKKFKIIGTRGNHVALKIKKEERRTKKEERRKKKEERRKKKEERRKKKEERRNLSFPFLSFPRLPC